MSFEIVIYRQLGASLQTIEVESRKLEELKAIVFQDFRREMLNKLKKQSESRVSYMYIGRIVLHGERWIYKYLNSKALSSFSLGSLSM